MIDLIPGSPDFVERLLADRIGLDVASVGQGLIARGVEARMAQLGVRRVEDYQRILLGPSDEIQALTEEVVIPESWFFRDDRPFATLRDHVQTGWVDRPHRGPLSVLCLPCASGEEPYSIVIAALELGLARERLRVVAVDISERSLRRAAAGVYGSNAFRGMDPALQAKYFAPVWGRHLLKPAVRSLVGFERGNILDDKLLADQPPFDVVFCRNLLIYFDDPARVRAFRNLDRLTDVGGLLFLGHADRADHCVSSRFVALATKGSFAYTKQAEERVVPPAPVAPPRPPASAGPKPSRGAALRAPNPPAADNGPARPARPEPQDPKPTSSPTPTRAVLDRDEVMARASALADQGRYDEATRLIREQLGRVTLDAAAHFLLGIIHQAAGNRAGAEAELNKAVYLDPDHDESLLALALLARRKGDVAAEAVYRRRAERALARKGRG